MSARVKPGVGDPLAHGHIVGQVSNLGQDQQRALLGDDSD
jgi:hypothetical protein